MISGRAQTYDRNAPHKARSWMTGGAVVACSEEVEFRCRVGPGR